MTEQQKHAEWLASACHDLEKRGVCPANVTLTWCPMGDDGICENVTSEDWLEVLKKVEEERQ